MGWLGSTRSLHALFRPSSPHSPDPAGQTWADPTAAGLRARWSHAQCAKLGRITLCPRELLARGRKTWQEFEEKAHGLLFQGVTYKPVEMETNA